jgi:hypothetical protein
MISPKPAKQWGCHHDDNSPTHLYEYGLPAIALTAPAPAATTTAPKSTASTAGARFLWPRFIHGQGPATHFRTVESGNGRLGFGVRRHLNETEAARLPRELIRNDPR